MGKRQKRKRREGHPVAGGAASLQKPGIGRQANSLAAAMTMSPVPPVSKGGMIADGIAHDLHTGSVLAGENGNGVGCRHWGIGIDLEKLRAQLAKGAVVSQQCNGCGNGGNNNRKGKDKRVNNKGKGKAVRNNKQSVWICLACGQIGCGTLTLVRDSALQKSITSSKNGNGNNPSTESSLVKQMGDGHAKTHGKLLQHPVVMQLGQRLDCWCLVCNLQIYSWGGGSAAVTDSSQPNDALGLDVDAVDGGRPNGGSKPELLLQRAANMVQENLNRNNTGSLKLDVAETGQTPEVIKGCISPSSPMAAVVVNSSSSRRVIKGLMNLGNTCFFNSVMQNLVGVSMLRDHFSLEASMREGNLTTALRKFFQDMDVEASEKLDAVDRNPDGTTSGQKRTTRSRSLAGSIGSAVTPRGLFSAISTKAPRFKGYQQQDSHELLRCLLDGLHTEEESVRKSHSASGGSGAVREVESAAKSGASEEGRNNHHTADDEGSEAVADKTAIDTFVERMFGGQLSSTVSCCVCGHSSVVYEPFLDLSLPIPSKQSPRKNAPSVEQLPLSILPRSHQGHSGAGVSKGLKAPASLETKTSVVHVGPATEDSNQLAHNVTGISIVESGIGMSEVTLHVDSELVKSPDPTTPYKEHGTGVPDTYPPDVSSSAECASGPDLDASPDTWMDFLASDETSEEPGAMVVHTPKEVDEWSALARFQSQSQSQPPAGEAQGVDAGGKETSPGKNCYGREQRGSNFEDKVDFEESGCSAEEGPAVYGPLNNWKVLEGVLDGLSPGLTEVADAASQTGAEMHLSTPGSLATANSLSMMEGGLAVSSYAIENTVEIAFDSQQLVPMPSINKVEAVERSDSLVMQVVSEEDGDFDGVASMFEEASPLEKKGEDQPSWTLVESRQSESRSFLGQINGLDSDTACNGNSVEVDLFQFASNGGRGGSIKEGHDWDSFSSMSLEGCLLAFTKAEVLSGENAWACENCSRRLQDQWRTNQSVSCHGNQASEHLRPQSQTRRETCGKRASGYSDKDITALQTVLPAQEKTAEESNNSRELMSGMNYLVKGAAQPNTFETDIIETSTKSAEQHFTDSDTVDTEAEGLARTSVVDSEPNAGASMSPSMLDLELTSLLQQSASKDHSDESGNLSVIQADEFQPRTLHGASEFPLTSSVLPVTANDCSDIYPGRGGSNGREQTVLSEDVQASSSDVFFKDITVDMSGKVDSLSCNSDAEENGVLLEKSGPLHCLAGEKKLSLNGSYDIYEATTSSDVYQHRNFSLDSRQYSPLPAKISTVCNGGDGDSLEADRSSVQDTPKAFTVKQDATKRFLLSKAPPVLTVHLKRFAQDMHGRLSKLGGHVAFSEQLDLGPFMDQRNGNQQGCKYRLIGTVEHSGTMRGGHYVAYVMGPANDEEYEADSSSREVSTWYYISDSQVRKTSLESVLRSEAYLLFYERQASN